MRARDERGTGMVGTAFGAVVFLAFLSLAAHTLIGLYATSVLTSVAWDDARRISVHPNSTTEADAAEADAYQRLGGFKNVRIEVAQTNADVAFHVSAQRPNLLPAALAKATGLDRIDRTVHVRAERLQ